MGGIEVKVEPAGGREFVGVPGRGQLLGVCRDSWKRVAPQAWVINFTNPAGVVTEAMSAVLGRRVIGICDSPIGLARRALGALGFDGTRDAELDCAGLNHLGWLTALRVDGTDVLPQLLADPGAISSFEEGRLFGADWLRTLGAAERVPAWTTTPWSRCPAWSTPRARTRCPAPACRISAGVW